MNKPIKFRQKNGLTAYALACGDVQRIAHAIGTDYELRVDLWQDGSTYHVRAHEHGGRGRISWDTMASLSEARKAWAETVKLHHGKRIAAAKADKRFTVAREYSGDPEPYWVARIEGAPRQSWVGKSVTEAGAWMIVALHKEGMVGGAE